MNFKKLPLLELLNELFVYFPDSGEFVWRKRMSQNTKAGSIAGGINPRDGRRYLRVPGMGKFLASRIAWKMHTGRDPQNLIDHANRVRSDDRIANLREATHGQNI